MRQLQRSRVLWLPSLQTGFSYHRRDGNYQASNGAIVDVNRNSLQYGFGMGATGAGDDAASGSRRRISLGRRDLPSRDCGEQHGSPGTTPPAPC